MGAPDWIGLYLEEDLGSGDITGQAVFSATHQSRARIVARERLVVAGSAHAQEVFRRLGARATPCVTDGAWVEAGTTILEVEGPTRGLLAGERLALNLMSRMAGIASQTRDLVEALARDCAAAHVAGTRKTTPGFRAFEKEAIRIGGGDPHRMGLWDEAMVKDNHREAAGSVAEAVRRVRAQHPFKVVSAEVESLADALAAAAAGADWLLIDNQPPEIGRAWAAKVWGAHPSIKIEASGGITPQTISQYGWADRVSLGWLTQKTPARDIGMDWERNLPQQDT